MTVATERRTVSFRGRVQGVGFRATVESIARSHPVTGWVRNEPDGSVSCLAEGTGAGLDAFFDAILHQRRDFISDHDAEQSAATGEFGGFVIRY